MLLEEVIKNGFITLGLRSLIVKNMVLKPDRRVGAVYEDIKRG